MNQDYGQVKGEYSIEWGEYKPGVLTPDPVGSTTEISEDSDWLAEPAGVAEDDGDELPF
jgi:hypothetical protein